MNERLGLWLPTMPWRSGQPVLRTIIAVAAIGLSILFAVQFTPGEMTGVIGLLLLAGALLLCLRWPNLGLLALIFSSLVVRLEIGTGTQSALNITALMIPALVGLWVVDMIARQRRIELARSRSLWVMAAFVLVTLLAFITGQLPWFVWAEAAPLRAQLGGLGIIILAVAVFFLVAHQVKDVRWLQRLVNFFLVLSTIFMIGQAIAPIGEVTNAIYLREAAATAFWVFVVTFSFAQAFLNSALHPVWRIASGGLLLLTVGLAVGPRVTWASGWLPALVALVVMIVVARPRLAWLLVPLSAIALALLYQPIMAIVLTNEGYSLMTRWEAWRIVTEIARVSPILGLGPANYYYYTPLFDILGYRVQFNSHNQYIDIIAQTGLLGLLLLLWFLVEITALAFRLRQRVPEGFPRAYVYACLGGIAGIAASGMMGDWLLPFVYNVGLRGMRSAVFAWLFLGGLVALEQIYLRQPVTATTAATAADE
jgi:hypothetical protein